MLFERFPQEPEGLLARRLAKLVAKETLASVSDDLGLGGFMRVAMGEDEQQGRSNPGLLSDVCEAVIAALYLDGGLPAAKQFIAAAWTDRKSTRLNSRHQCAYRMPSSAYKKKNRTKDK